MPFLLQCPPVSSYSGRCERKHCPAAFSAHRAKSTAHTHPNVQQRLIGGLADWHSPCFHSTQGSVVREDVMLNVKVWALALGSFLAVSFVLCVLGGLIAPDLPITHRTLEAVLPGFVWISPGAFILGLVEMFLFGVYAGIVFVGLHNFFARRSNERSAASRFKAA